MRIRVKPVEKLHDVEAAFVDIEVNVPRLKGWRTGLPDPCVRIQALDFLPDSESDSPAVDIGMDKQQIQMVVLRAFVDLQHETADNPSVLTDSVGSTALDAAQDGFPGDDFAGRFARVVAQPEFFHRAVSESALVVQDELLPVGIGELRQSDPCHVPVLLQKEMPGNKRLKPIVPSSPGILSNRRPAKLSLYDPLRYGALSSDDRYSVLHIIADDPGFGKRFGSDGRFVRRVPPWRTSCRSP